MGTFYQMQLEFDFPFSFEPVKKTRCRRWKPHHSDLFIQLELNFNPPRNDKQLYLQLQDEYLRTHSKIAERKMWNMLVDYAQKAIVKERDKKGFFISEEDIQIKAYNAASSTFIQYCTRPDFKIENPLGYVYLWVQTELYYHTKVDDIFKNIHKMKSSKVRQYLESKDLDADFF